MAAASVFADCSAIAVFVVSETIPKSIAATAVIINNTTAGLTISFMIFSPPKHQIS